MDGEQGQESPSKTVATRGVDPLLGTVLADRYSIQEILGRGGMGVVYKARHELMGRTVAIKMLLPTLVYDEIQVARFQREARAASRMNHTNIIALHDFGLTADGLPYIVMDYLEGRSLSELIKATGQIDVANTLHIFIQICDALDHAHKLGIIHRDLKPGNIMLLNNDQDHYFVKVVDFGIAKLTTPGDEDSQRLTSTGEVFGSPVYMSPEQCSGADLDARSDMYSLGCVLYETLTGKLPFIGRTAIETITRQLQSEPPPFSQSRPDLIIPNWLENIALRTVQKNPAHRFQSMQELKEALILGAAQSGDLKIGAGGQFQPSSEALTNPLEVKAIVDPAPAGKGKAIVIAIVALLIGLGGGAAFMLLSHKQAPAKSGAITTPIKAPLPATAATMTNSTTAATTTTPTVRGGTTTKTALPEMPAVQPTTTPDRAPQRKPTTIVHSKVETRQRHKPVNNHPVMLDDDAAASHATPLRHKLSGDQWLYQQRVNTEHYGDAAPLPVNTP